MPVKSFVKSRSKVWPSSCSASPTEAAIEVVASTRMSLPATIEFRNVADGPTASRAWDEEAPGVPAAAPLIAELLAVADARRAEFWAGVPSNLAAADAAASRWDTVKVRSEPPALRIVS